MKKIILILFCSTLYYNSIGQCNPPINVFNSNINYYNADVNWNYQTNINNYKIRYKLIGATSWSYKNNIDSISTSENLNNLSPQNFYLWQIRSYCDSTGTNYSQWSIADTFYTNTINCPSITGQYTNNISYNNATSNWAINTNVNRYKIRYKIYGTTIWSFLGPIFQPTNNRTIPSLQQNTTYEWEVMAFYDSTSLSASLWSIPDTFTTTTFIYSAFNPIITNTIDNTICNNATNLTLFASQSLNEPDIGTSAITTDGGYFNIQSLSMGDSVGYAIINTSTQIISATLKADIIAGQNYAIINSYDSSGALIGFFAIENESGGIKISSTSPNDGNNYTTGFTSEVHFTNLFINPNISGPLNFYTDIQSELNDQFNDTATVIINCISPISENSQTNNLSFEIYDLLGRKTKFKDNTVLIYKYSNGKIRKIITQRK
tara:strand:- start:41 stop:1339 length:1299 start_codon:yes stop_codon:yes gene_type:complete